MPAKKSDRPASNSPTLPWLERPLHPSLPAITNEIAIFAAIILLAIVSRFYNLGLRVMSHDESLHTYFSWLLYKGNGYQHTPMMHGPLQFHLIALSYFLFGVSDFTARIPAAVFNIAIFFALWNWRRYLGHAGTIFAAIMFLISPFMLYYGRYVREDAYVGLSGLLLLYAILRYLETGGARILYLLAAAMILHVLTKETSYIYAAQALLFLAIYFIARVTRRNWEGKEAYYRAFIISLAVGILLIGSVIGIGLVNRGNADLSATEVAAPANPEAAGSPLAPETSGLSPSTILGVAGLLALIAASVFLIRGYSWERVRSERSFDLLILTGTLIFPLLAAFAIKVSEPWLHVVIPTTAQEVQGLMPRDVTIVSIFILAMFGISIGVGQLWNRNWWKYALTFWVPFVVLYTTVFTNSDGFFTGVVGSLGYWLVQQSVQRGSQPWYYYILVQIPVYEFLPALGVILAIYLGLRRRSSAGAEKPTGHEEAFGDGGFPAMFSLLVWWIFSSILALSYAGERMPWLTYHMTWPMILLAGWGLGHLAESTDWQGLRQHKAPLALGLIFIFFTSLTASLISLLGTTPPFQGKELAQLQATGAFILPAIAAIASAGGLTYLLRDWTGSQAARTFTLAFFGLLAILTMRASFRAAYITYDQATEYLVYAHGATGIKEVIAQAREISERTTGGMGINLAYDASAPDTGVSWPFVWYLRDFTNQHSFDQPTRSLRDSVVVIVDAKNFDKIEAALGPGYYRFDYIRMWWPNQDYFGLVSERQPSIPFPDDYPCRGLLSFFKLLKTRDFSRICGALTDPRIRAGIFDIWLNRDYTLYAEASGHSDLTLATWQPADQMRMYVRKDVAAQIWNYGVVPSVEASPIDPYEGKYVPLVADLTIDSAQPQSTALNAPRSLAIAADGSIFVADSRNHRIVHFDASGALINQWGTPSGNDPSNPAASPLGTFNEPWGVALGPDGTVYVTDTWNHRVQKFSPDGVSLGAWGHYGQGESPDAFYGPRGIAVDAAGHVFVADTGNKRIVVFDADGNYLAQFGSAGLDPGQFDEPVGVAVDADGILYVADTWNQRIQTFQPAEDGLSFTPLKQWDVAGWYGQSLDNKPFIAVDAQKRVFITDPEGFRVIEFDQAGTILQTWGDYGDGPANFQLPAGIAADAEGHIWVTDAGNNRVMRFTLP